MVIVNRKIIFFNFRKANFPQLYEIICKTDWTVIEQQTDVTEACSLFYHLLQNIFRQAIPLAGNKPGDYPIWYTSGIISDIKIKSKLFKTYKKTKLEIHLSEYKAVRSRMKANIEKAFIAYTEKVEIEIKNEY